MTERKQYEYILRLTNDYTRMKAPWLAKVIIEDIKRGEWMQDIHGNWINPLHIVTIVDVTPK